MRFFTSEIHINNISVFECMRNVFFKICQGHIRKRGVLKHEQCLKKEGIDALAISLFLLQK